MSCQRENKVSDSVRFTQVYCTRKVAYPKLLPSDCSVIPLLLDSSLCNFLCSPNMFSVEIGCLSSSIQISPEFIRTVTSMEGNG